MFETNYSKKILDGIFEVRVTEVRETKTKDGLKDMLVIDYTVRSDVEQEGRGELIRFDNATESMGFKLNAISKAVGLPEGKKFELYDWGKEIKSRCLKLKVVAGDKYPEIKDYYRSDNPVTVEQLQKASDENLPF